MTKNEVLQKICDAALAALRSSDEFNDACEQMGDVGLQHRVLINIEVFERETAAGERQATDADFLRSLRIAPDLEAQ